MTKSPFLRDNLFQLIYYKMAPSSLNCHLLVKICCNHDHKSIIGLAVFLKCHILTFGWL